MNNELKKWFTPVVQDWFKKVNTSIQEGVDYSSKSSEDLLDELNDYISEHKEEFLEQIGEKPKVKRIYEGGRFAARAREKRTAAGIASVSEPTEAPKPIEDTDDDDDDTSAETVEVPASGETSTKLKLFKVNQVEGSDRYIYYIVDGIIDALNNPEDVDDENVMSKITPLSILDVSEIKDFTAVFAFTNTPNIDLSRWDVSHATTMEGMFYKSSFNNDSILGWNVSNCTNFKNMFVGSKMSYSVKSYWVPGTLDNGNKAKLPVVGQNSLSTKDENKRRTSKLRANWKDAYKAAMKSEKESSEKTEESMKYNHIKSRQEFLTEGKFADAAKKVFNKAKDFIKGMFAKINDYFVAAFDENGSLLPVVSPITSVNYISEGNVAGVQATFFGGAKDEYTNPSADREIKLQEGYYDLIGEDSIEYKNWRTLCEHLGLSNVEESYKASVDEGLSAVSGGLTEVKDKGSKDFEECLYDLLDDPKGGNLLVWGAPGIGKSSIPKAVIQAMNTVKDKNGNAVKDKDGKPMMVPVEERRGLIVADCGQMTTDGFGLPLPTVRKLSDMISMSPYLQDKAKKLGISDDDMQAMEFKVSADAPKTWLPMYKPTGDPEKDELLDSIANGCVNPVYDENGRVKGFQETGNGGILMLDEYFRADGDIFRRLMNIPETRSYGEYVLGSKWGILICSNRPFDDSEVAQNFKRGISGAQWTRFAHQINFVPDFSEWCKWARRHGFDENTLAFIGSKKTPVQKNPINGLNEPSELLYWHHVDVDASKDPSRYVTAFATPRSWAKMIELLNKKKDKLGYKTLQEFCENDKERFDDIVVGGIGMTVGREYVKFMSHDASEFDPSSVLFDPEYKTNEDVKPVIAELETYIRTNYSKNERPTPEEMNNIANFFVNNYKDKGGANHINRFFDKLVDYLDIANMTGEEDDRLAGVKDWNLYSEFAQICADNFPQFE